MGTRHASGEVSQLEHTGFCTVEKAIINDMQYHSFSLNL